MADVRNEVAAAVDAMKASLAKLQQAKEAHEQRTLELRSTVVRKLTELREADYPAALELAKTCTGPSWTCVCPTSRTAWGWSATTCTRLRGSVR